ncbi:MAG: BamA/TamA family outer membrane protein [candidate division Zixibacteria bacterium]|nr:BamA/TamA family outer membrane protein [candidate division Zixibacteria bacterium]
MVRNIYKLLYFLTISSILIVVLSVKSSAMDKSYLRWLRDKPPIDSIVIEGNEFLSESHIKKRMYSRENTLWRTIKGDRRRKIQRETPGRDSLEIKYLYLTKGFLNVRMAESFEMLPDSSALVRLQIHEGKQYFYGEKIISGNYPEKFYNDFIGIAGDLKKEKPINIFSIQAVEFEMKTILANNGYPYAVINPQIDTSAIDAEINFNINSDSLVYFGDVEIDGLRFYPEYTARRELKIKKDNLYSRKTIIDSQRRLYESGYFTTLQLKRSTNSPDRLHPDFTLRLRNRKPQYFTFQTGAGQSEYKDLIWDISSRIGTRNFIGSRKASIIADYSLSLGDDVRLVTHRYRARFTEPWLFGVRMPLSITGELEPTIKDPVQDYRIGSWSFSVATQKKIGDKTITNLGLQYESVKISGVSEELAEIIKEENRISVRRKIYFTYRRDSRNNLFIPTRGSVTEFMGEYVGGFLRGDASFTHMEVGWSRYKIVWPGWVAAARIKICMVEAFGDSKEVPINDRLYLGGANTVRGFRENSLGPVGTDGNPFGADFALLYNQEFRWKTLQVFSVIPVLNDLFRNFPLWQSIFVDVGNGFSDHREFEFKNLAVSYGTGFQLVSPAGPIRVDYARRVKTEKYDFADRWHFTILYAF